MTKRLQSPLLLACAALLFFATTADAQVQRPFKTPYISAYGGLGLYGGDIDGAPDNDPDNVLSDPGYAAAGEIGYQFTPSLAFGVAYNYGNYPELQTDFDGTFTNAVESRSQIQAAFRYFLFPSSSITPYVKLGVSYSFEPDFSEITDNAPGVGGAEETTDAWGPLVGGGVDLLLGRKFSLFLEANAAYLFPDNAIDGTNPGAQGIPGDNSDFDWLALIGGGARFWFKAAVTEVEATIDCATSLEVGQAGTFTAFVNEDASGPLTYSWDWGDGTSSDGLVATHSYSSPGTYTVSFTATGPANSDTETCLVTVNEPPAEAPALSACAVTPMTANIGETVSFSATAAGTRPLTFEWNFGDGTTANTLNATHVYNEVGTYNATLTVTNEAGSDTCTLTVTVVDRFCDEVTELNTVFFEPGMSTLTEVAEARLAENLAVLERCPDICVIVNAYADSRENNPLRLSERRAAAVEAYYVQNGIDADRIAARGLGVAPDDNYKEDQGAGSRRAESIPVPCDDMDDMMDDMDMDDDDMDMDDGM